MKKIIFLFLLLLISKLSYSQMDALNNSDLRKIIFNEHELKNFINNKDEFITYSATKFDLLELNHPIDIYNFNRIVKNDKIRLKLLGIPVKELYGYVKNSEYYCLYLLINIDNREQINRFIAELGSPWNITKEDYEKGDFDMLLWQKNELKISIMRNFDRYKLLTITNLPLADLINNSPW
jgi:hypothetical protein